MYAACILALVPMVLAILPAGPSDDTSDFSDTNSTLHLTWYPFGSYVDDRIALVNAASQRSGLDEGAFTQFSDAYASDDDFTTTPWIAFISCDRDPSALSNTTDDTFSLAKRRGAVAALLYSLNASTCVIHPEFEESLPDLNLDIYATTSINQAHLLESLFDNTNASFINYNASVLNASAQAITQSLTSHNAREMSFLIATLAAENASQIPGQPDSGGLSGDVAGTGSAVARWGISCILVFAALMIV